MTILTSETTALQAVTHDLYRDIHKGIRAELFAVTQAAGRLDPSCADDRAAVAAHLRSIADLLVSHAEHEDGAIQPVLHVELPALAERIESEHELLEGRVRDLTSLADVTGGSVGAVARHEAHTLYVELASFTSAYLAHQDLEERVVMPALESVVGADAVVAIHQAIVGSIPPPEMARSLALMLPAMNVDDRTELLGGMQAGAPAEVFGAVWSLAGSVLTPADHGALAARLGLA